MRSGRAQLISLLWAMVGVGTEGAQHMNLSNGRAEPEADRAILVSHVRRGSDPPSDTVLEVMVTRFILHAQCHSVSCAPLAL